MFKGPYLKHIIPDVMFAAGIILLLLGIFFLIQPSDSISDNEKVVAAFEKNRGDLQLDKELELSVTGRDVAVTSIDSGESMLSEDMVEKDKEDKLSFKFFENGKAAIFPLDINLKGKLKDLSMITQYMSDTEGNCSTPGDNAPEFSLKTDAFKKKKVTVVIPEGSSGIEVAHIFDESNLITYHEFIRLLVLFDVETRIKAGKYKFDSDSSVSDILSKILIN